MCHGYLRKACALHVRFLSLQVSSDSVNRTFTALIMCDKGNEEGEGNGGDSRALPHLYNAALFIPEGRSLGFGLWRPAEGAGFFFFLVEN